MGEFYRGYYQLEYVVVFMRSLALICPLLFSFTIRGYGFRRNPCLRLNRLMSPLSCEAATPNSKMEISTEDSLFLDAVLAAGSKSERLQLLPVFQVYASSSHFRENIWQKRPFLCSVKNIFNH